MSGSKRVVLAGGAMGFNWLPVYAALRNGMFERRGIEVELKRTGSVQKATAAVLSGEAQLAITPPEGAIADHVGGGTLRIIAGNVNRLPLSLVAHPRFKRIEELKGAVLGTSSLTEGTAIYTQAMLAQHGLRYPDDYSFDVVGVHPARWQALKEGRIDAAVQLIPLNFVAFDEGWSNLGEVSDYIPEILFTGLICDNKWASANADLVCGFLAALSEGTSYVLDPANDGFTIPMVMEAAQADEAYARRSLDYMREKGVFRVDLAVVPAAFAKSIELMVAAGLLPGEQADAALATIEPGYLAALEGA
jgi:ABC-type nitrate/sulfonate/bicarbonate transport system substrate-binding protein